MNASTVLVAVGIILVCVGIHLGVASLPGILLLGAGLAMMFLR